jgi:hypothetical protein
MESNPMVERQKAAEEEHRKEKAFRYPYRICCVYIPDDGCDFPIFHDVKRFCEENALTFYSRPYDIDKYKQEDMVIKRLLAFHVYLKGYVQDTYYYDEDPVHKIQLIVWAYQDVEREKARARQRRQERWDTLKETLGSIFTLDHFKQKPALDREASQSKARLEVRKTESETSSPKSGAKAPVPLVD